MEQKNRLKIVAAIIVLIAGAMFTSFGRNLFALNTPEIVLPDPTTSQGDVSEIAPKPSTDAYQQVEITPGTVQNVIRTLSRPDSYYRESTLETFWKEGSSTIPFRVWQDEGWTHIRQVLPSGVIRHDLVGDDTLYYWYDGSAQYHSAPADEASSDLAQRLPTYETVLELEQDHITAAQYVMYEDLPCIQVDVQLTDPDRLERYWVSVDNGLLVCAQAEEAGQITYRMTTNGVFTSPCPSSASFELPDGTVLHSMS